MPKSAKIQTNTGNGLAGAKFCHFEKIQQKAKATQPQSKPLPPHTEAATVTEANPVPFTLRPLTL